MWFLVTPKLRWTRCPKCKKATFKCRICNPPTQKKSTQRASSTKTSKSTKKSSSSPPPPPPPPLLLPHLLPLLLPHLHPPIQHQVRVILLQLLLCMITACAQWVAPVTSAAVALATKTEVDSLLQRVLDLEVRLKTENKSLRLQVLALEERNDHLESEIAMLRSNTSKLNKAFQLK